MELKPIPRIPAREFRPSRWVRQPWIVTDNVSNWRALHNWEPAYLKAAAGACKVAVREMSGAPRNVYQCMQGGGNIAFADYLDWVLEIAGRPDIRAIAATFGNLAQLTRAIADSGFESSYYLDVKLAALSPRLLADTTVPAWFRQAPADIIFWCGVLGTSSGLHSDIKPNCNVQVVGSKSFILFSPAQTRLLYPMPRMTHCNFDPNLPDFDSFPLARRAMGWQCILQAGESLYVPVGWYHQVTVVSPWAINVNFFWPRPFPQGLATPVLWALLMRRGWAGMRIAATRLRARSRAMKGAG
jgi:hypothetical protein